MANVLQVFTWSIGGKFADFCKADLQAVHMLILRILVVVNPYQFSSGGGGHLPLIYNPILGKNGELSIFYDNALIAVGMLDTTTPTMPCNYVIS